MFEGLKQRLKDDEEGNVPCMYLDSQGYVTVGVGHLLAPSEAAAALSFVLPSGLPAGVGVIRDEYARVHDLEPNRLPQYYRERTTLRLSQDAIDALLDADVETMHRGLSALLPGIDGFPAPAQDALLDMAFQFGPHGLVSKFPHLVESAKAGEWAGCADECHSAGIPAARNEARAELFRQARVLAV